MKTRNLELGALDLAVGILNDLEVDYWLCNGTLLGLIRDGRLISWDTDIDIAIFDKSLLHQISTKLGSAGAVLLDEGRGSDYFIFDYRGVKIDFNVFRDSGNHFETLWRVSRDTWFSRLTFKTLAVAHLTRPRVMNRTPAFLWTLEGYKVLSEDLVPTGWRDFNGLVARVPANPEAVLEYIYGPKWRVPKRDYNWRLDGVNNASAS